MKLQNEAVTHLIDVNTTNLPQPAVDQMQAIIDSLRYSNTDLHDKLDQALGSVLAESLDNGFSIAWQTAQDLPVEVWADVEDQGELDTAELLDLLESAHPTTCGNELLVESV